MLKTATARRWARAFLAGALLAMTQAAALAESVKVTFLLVNDFYKMNEEKGRGGMARLAAAVKGERAKGGNVIFAHGGDTISPSLMSGFDQGASMIEFFNTIPPDIFVPGNHEYDFGKEVFLRRMGEAKFPLLAANLRDADRAAIPGILDTKLLEFGGVRIGLVGATLDNSAELTAVQGLKFAPTFDTVRAAGKALKAAGADITVAVVHADKATDQRLLGGRAADIILSGHNHELQIDYDGRGLLAESAVDAQYLVAIDVAIEVKTGDSGRSVSWQPGFRIIDTATLTPDPDTAALVKRFELDLSKELDVEIATLTEPLDSRSAVMRGGEAAMGNFVADAIKAQTGAEAALINGGGLRAGKEYPVGHRLTRRDVLGELPFGNRTLETQVTGAALRAALENGVSQLENKAGRFPQVSGIKLVVDPAAPAGARIVSVEVNGAPLDEAKVYRIATNDFIIRGGDGYVAMAGAGKLSDDAGGKLVSNDVMAYARKLGTVASKVEGRIVFK